jgi:hypothetical protein
VPDALLTDWASLYERDLILRSNPFVGYRDFCTIIRRVAAAFQSPEDRKTAVTNIFLRAFSGIPPSGRRDSARIVTEQFLTVKESRDHCRTEGLPDGAIQARPPAHRSESDGPRAWIC